MAVLRRYQREGINKADAAALKKQLEDVCWREGRAEVSCTRSPKHPEPVLPSRQDGFQSFHRPLAPLGRVAFPASASPSSRDCHARPQSLRSKHGVFMSQSSSYSFTEKEAHSQEFCGKRPVVLDVPYLLTTQIESYQQFLQAETNPPKRKPEGIAGRVRFDLPDRPTTRWRASSSSVSTRPPGVRRQECQQRPDLLRALRAGFTVLVIMDKEAVKPTVKEVKEQEVYMGEIPLMTTTGSFIVNGTERVIVSQLHRSPGVFFEHDRKTHSSRASCCSRRRIIPYRGSGSTSSSIPGHPVLPGRPSPQDAGHDPAEGHRPDARSRSSRTSSSSTACS